MERARKRPGLNSLLYPSGQPGHAVHGNWCFLSWTPMSWGRVTLFMLFILASNMVMNNNTNLKTVSIEQRIHYHFHRKKLIRQITHIIVQLEDFAFYVLKFQCRGYIRFVNAFKQTGYFLRGQKLKSTESKEFTDIFCEID